MTGADLLVKILKAEGVRQCLCFPMTPIIEAMARARLARHHHPGRSAFAGKHGGRRLALHQRPRDRASSRFQALAGSENAFAGVAPGAHGFVAGAVSSPGPPRHVLCRSAPPTFDSKANYAATTKMAQKVLAADHMPVKLRQALHGAPLRPAAAGNAGAAGRCVRGRGEWCAPSTRRCDACAPRPTRGAVREAARNACSRPRRPMIWAGQGVLWAEASDELREVAELLGAPCDDDTAGQERDPRGAPAGCGRGALSPPPAMAAPLPAGERLRARRGAPV